MTSWSPTQRLDQRPERERKPLPKCVIREATHGDRGFIFGNFLKSANGCFAYRSMPRPAFDRYASEMLEGLLDRSQALVVSTKEDPDKLVGFAIHERPFRSLDQIVLHYVYVIYEHREQGVGSALIRAIDHDPKKTQLFTTHMSTAWFHIGPRFGAIHNPFYLWPQFHREKEKAE